MCIGLVYACVYFGCNVLKLQSENYTPKKGLIKCLLIALIDTCLTLYKGILWDCNLKQISDFKWDKHAKTQSLNNLQRHFLRNVT